jgi:hypothetical protein
MNRTPGPHKKSLENGTIVCTSPSLGPFVHTVAKRTPICAVPM